MANWCTINMDIQAKNSTEAGKIYKALQLSQTEAIGNPAAMFIGSASKYLFPGDFDWFDEGVCVCGFTRWAFQFRR